MRIAHFALVLAIFTSSSTGAADTKKAPELAIESYKLPNGLKVVLHRDPAVPRVAIAVAYHVGSKNERAGKTGFAHFFEHMMFRGTKNVPNYDIPLQESGTQTNAFTSEDMTVYIETVPTEYLERALYLEAERLAFLPSALNQEKFDTEREVVKNERRQSFEDVPYGLAGEAILAAVFPKGHPYSWSVIGSMKDLSAATLDDLKNFFAEYYHPGNATLSLAGDFDPVSTKALINKYFGPIAPGPAPRRPVAPPSPPVALTIRQVDQVTLPRIYWSWPTVEDDHPDSAALELLSAVLSSGDASRMHKALVEEQKVAKDVNTENDTKEIAGIFTITATAAEGKTIAEVEKALNVEIEKIKAKPPTQAEIDRALAKFETSSYAQFTSPLGRATILAIGFSQKDDPAYYRKDILRHFDVTPADVQRVARKYLVADRVALSVEPPKPGEAETPAVAVGPNPSNTPDPLLTERKHAAGPDWTKMPEPTKPRMFTPPTPIRKTLANGLTVWFVPWKTLPLVTAKLTVPVGTIDDPADKGGLADLTSTLLTMGTASKSNTELTELLDTLGISLGAGTSSEETSIGLSSLSRNFDSALKLMGEVLATPRFDAEDFSREKQLQMTSISQGPDSLEWLASRSFRALLHGPDHPFGRPGDGTIDSVKAITLADMKTFYQSRFSPKGAKMVVVGDVDAEKLFASIEAALAGWKPKDVTRPVLPAIKAVPEPKVIHLVDKPGATQSIVEVGRLWKKRGDPSYYATFLGNRILGADFLSRLNQNLRERNGFTYGAGSMVLYRKHDSIWVIQSSVRADVTGAALKEVLLELDGVAPDGKTPLTTEEVETARDAEIQSFPEEFEDISHIAGAVERIASYDLPNNYLATVLPSLAGTTEEQVKKSISELVDPSLRTILVVGDRATIEPQLKSLGLTVKVIEVQGVRASR